MNLCSQSKSNLQSRMTAAARSRIIEAPTSPAALIISTTMPDVPVHLVKSGNFHTNLPRFSSCFSSELLFYLQINFIYSRLIVVIIKYIRKNKIVETVLVYFHDALPVDIPRSTGQLILAGNL